MNRERPATMSADQGREDVRARLARLLDEPVRNLPTPDHAGPAERSWLGRESSFGRHRRDRRS